MDKKAMKIKESEGALRALLSLFVPGAGHLVNGEVGRGLAFLLLALIAAIPTLMLGYIIIGIISACMCSPRYSCSNCRSVAHEKAVTCFTCGSNFE